jgi:hypothetical protein
MKRIALAFAFGLASGPAIAQEPVAFGVGQVWTLKNAPDEARFTVMQIDQAGSHKIVHGSPTGFPSVPMGDHVITLNGGHMPFSEDALRRSVDMLERSNAPVTKSFREGYAEWKSANGGAFTLTVSEAIAVTVETLRKQQVEGQ